MNKKVSNLIIIAFVSFGIHVVGCEKRSNLAGGAKSETRLLPADRAINVITTTGMIGDMVSNLAAERAKVTVLMGPGVDPHLYKASEGDVSRMMKADIILYNGLHLEGKMAELFEKIEGRVLTLAVAEGIDKSKLLAPPEFEGAFDPHIWFDVSMWISATEHVKDFLIKHDPPNRDLYEANYNRFRGELEVLHTFIKEQSQTIEEEKRVLITAHDAFNYFGKAYGYEVRGLQGISTATEAGAGDVKDLADFIFQRRIPAIFVETSVPERNIVALQKAVKSKGFDVLIGGNLYSDSMGDSHTPEGTYVGMVMHNITSIVSGLIVPDANN